jgi:hypothetical protein
MKGPIGAMTDASTKRRRLACVAAVTLFASFTVLFLSPSRAFAAGNLSSVVLADTLPGMVVAPPGPTNGPATVAVLQHYLPVDKATGDKLTLDVAGGIATMYVRSWTSRLQNGDSVFIFAFQFTNPAEQLLWLASFNAGLLAQPGVAPLSVPGISGVHGYTTHLPASSGVPFTQRYVSFNKGDIAFVVLMSSQGDLADADAVGVAVQQAITAPGSSSSKILAYKVGEGIGAALLVLVIVVVIRKIAHRKRTRSSVGVTVARSSKGTYPAPTPYLPGYGPKQPGWVTNIAVPGEQVYWDGQTWSGFKRLIAGQWVEG